MSVAKSKQTEGKLLVVTKARELATYTIKICSNEKNFPKRYRWCITAKTVDCAIDVSSNVNAANSIYVNDDNKKDYQLRRQYQTKALAETYALLSMIDIAYSVFSIESKRIEYWTRLVNEVQVLLRNWRKSDYDRYGK